MKLKHALLILNLFLFTACGGNQATATQHVPLIPDGPEEDEPGTAVTFQSTMWKSEDETGRNCEVHTQGDGTKMVSSSDNDWYFYVNEAAKVNCSRYGGSVEAKEGRFTVVLEPLMPLEGSAEEGRGEVMKAVGEQFSKKAVRDYDLESPLRFQEILLGETEREAECAEASFYVNDAPWVLHVCITAIVNARGELLVHTASMAGPNVDGSGEVIFETVGSASASWFRDSDTDGAGNLVSLW